MKTQKGFAALEGILIIVIVGLIAGTGWYVMKSKNQTEKGLENTASSSQPSSSKTLNATKIYKNDVYGFSFSYPSNWTLTTDLSNIGRGQVEGEVYVTSLKGTKVHFNPNLGGKGGDCWDDQANDYTTRTCSTQKIISVEKLPSSSSVRPIFFYHTALTAPTDTGGATTYFVEIRGGDNEPDKPGTNVGAYLHPYDEISNTKTGYVTVFVEGSDDSKSNSPDFFSTNEVAEATPILKSFKLL